MVLHHCTVIADVVQRQMLWLCMRHNGDSVGVRNTIETRAGRLGLLKHSAQQAKITLLSSNHD